MRIPFTRSLGLAALGLIPLGALHAQTLDPRAALEKALATQAQWGSGYPAADIRVSSAYADPGGLEHVYLQQLYRGIPVYNQVQSLAFKGGQLAAHQGRFVPAKQLAALPTTPALTAAAAVSRALQHLGASGTPTLLGREEGPEARHTFEAAGVARRAIVASLTWALDPARQPHLAWNVNVEMADSPDWWNVRVDASTGAIVDQDNWTSYEAAPTATRALPPPPPAATSATYRVVPYPQGNPRNGLQIETNPWLKAGASNNATSLGWHYDGTTDYAYTRGNNVLAYDDAANTNMPGAYAQSQSALPTLSFLFQPDFALAPSVAANHDASVTNLFYWNNIVHDITYQYGFTEPAGNFQVSNQSRGGVGGDPVRAEAQDGSGTNNANFSTPPDGTSGRMQMYLWNTAPAPAYSLTVSAPATIAGNYTAVEGTFSTNNRLSSLGPISGQLALYTDAAGSNLGCNVYGGTTPLTGKIALIYRGTCNYTVKVKNAQTAGAIAVVMVNSVAGAPVTMGGSDNTITIPAVMVSQADGATLAAQVANGVQLTLPKAPYVPPFDAGFDAEVIAHEYGHGVSTRLTGGPANSSCLNNAEQAGEGWSDYLSLMLTTNWASAQLTDGPTPRPTGTYVAGQSATGAGIRRYPYSTSLTVDPLTYANVAASTEVHNIGEVWCSTLWDMTWNIIQQRGTIEPNLYNAASTGGNAIALQLMVQGLKLQTCQPGFLDSRDAILAADSLLYGGQYHCAIWSAFARRGMGYSAVQGLSTNATDQTAAFDMPPPLRLQRQTALQTGNVFNVNFQVSCDCPTTNPATYTLTDELPTGLQFVSSSTGGTLVGNKVTFSNIAYTSPGQARTFSFQAQATPTAACAIATPVDDNRDNLLVGGLTSQSLSGAAGWVPSTTHSVSGSAWFATPPATPTDFVLTSAPFTPTGLSMLVFSHYFDFESTYDGGTVELSTDNGTTWQNATNYFVENGYNSTFDNSTTGAGQRCFSGRSVSGATRFIRSLLDLRSFAGQSVRLRFRTRTDDGSPSTFEGWYVDNIQVLNGCGGPQMVEFRPTGGTLQSSQSIFTYLLPNAALAAQSGSLAAATQFTAHPNPFGTAGLQLQLALPTAQAGLALTLYDVAGRTLLRRTVAQAPAGTTTLTWPEAATLPGGLYLLRLQLPDGSSTTLRIERE